MEIPRTPTAVAFIEIVAGWIPIGEILSLNLENRPPDALGAKMTELTSTNPTGEAILILLTVGILAHGSYSIAKSLSRPIQKEG